MSILSNDHVFDDFTSGKSVAVDATQRLAVISFKTVTDKVTKKETKRDSKCVSIPQIQVDTAQMNAIKGHIVAMVEKAQDGIIREMVLAGKTSVNNADISFDAVVEYLDAESAGTRLRKEDVIAWFNAEDGFGQMLAVSFADQLGISDTPTEAQENQINQSLNRYRELYAKLAGGKTSFDAPVATKLKEKLVQCGNLESDVIATRFVARLDKMINAVPEDYSELL